MLDPFLKRNFWDIETGPQSIDRIKSIVGEFDPDEFRKQKKKQFKKATTMEAKLEEARAEYEAKLLERASLDPLIGRILAIGYQDKFGKKNIIDCDDERSGISEWLSYITKSDEHFYGWNTFNFDLEFIRQRALILGIRLPMGFYSQEAYRNKWSKQTDLMIEFTGHPSKFASLDSVSKALGHTGKNGKGSEFHSLWSKGGEHKVAASNYLFNDLDMTALVGERILDAVELIPSIISTSQVTDDIPL